MTPRWRRVLPRRFPRHSKFARSFTTQKNESPVPTERIISALVVNRPGTLAHIADMFGIAGQNISSLCVRPTVVPELSRVTINIGLREGEVTKFQKRLRSLVCVSFFHITSVQACVENKELMIRSQVLIRLAPFSDRDRLQSILDEFGATVVDQDNNAVIPNEQLPDPTIDDKAHKSSEMRINETFVHLVEDPDRIADFIAALKQSKYDIQETQSCAPLFLDRSQSTLDAADKKSFTREVNEHVEELQTDPHPARKLHPSDEPTSEPKPSSYTPSSTYEMHTDERGYFMRDRLQLHARIAHQLYEGVPQDLTRPKFVLLLGIPGSGKSSLLSHLDSLGELTLGDFVNFDVDEVIALLPEFYHAMLNVGLGNEFHADVDRPLPRPQARYQMCRAEARFILHKNLHSSIMCRKNIILHGSGKSFHNYMNIVDQVLAAGFDTQVVCLDISTDVACDRVEKRSNNGYGRDVPKSLVDFTASMITRTFRLLSQRVENAHLFDSQDLPPRLVWSKQDSNVVVTHGSSDPTQRKYGL